MDVLISRQDVIDAIVTWTVEDRPNEVMPTDLVDRVNSLPSAQKKGEWIQEIINIPFCEHETEVVAFKCSLCGYREDGESKFCANCGADMRKR